jgi:hypothetical protein
MLDERELWKLLQRFDIEVAERPIFENWLYMALLTGAIPLPLAKFDKFNKPIFRGRRWAWVDPLKEVQSSALEVANKFTSRTRIIEDSDVDADFEQVLFELAEEEMLMTELGMDATPVVGKVSPTKPAEDTADSEDVAGEAQPGQSAAKSITAAKKDMTPSDVLALIRATQARPTTVSVNVPPIEIPAPTIDMSKFKFPEQKAPVVNFTPPEVKVNLPEVKAPDVVVNVAPPSVRVTNEVKIPKAKRMKVKRDDDGKMTEMEAEYDG